MMMVHLFLTKKVGPKNSAFYIFGGNFGMKFFSKTNFFVLIWSCFEKSFWVGLNAKKRNLKFRFD